MVAYSFKAQFRTPIQLKTKRHTIRAKRIHPSRHARPGETLQLYTGMRTRQCSIIGLGTCAWVHPIRLDLLDDTVYIHATPEGEIVYDTPKMLDAFAQTDGFDDWAAMVAFWKAEHEAIRSFDGDIIGWGGTFREAPAKEAA